MDEKLVMTILAGVLVAIACWGLLYGVVMLLNSREARVRARVKRFVTDDDQSSVTDVQQRKQLRQALFSQMDERWREGSLAQRLFKRLIDDMGKADLQTSLSEIVLIQFSVGIGTALVTWLLAPAFKLPLAALGFILGIMLFRSYLKFKGRRRIAQFDEQLPDTLSILASSVRGGFSLFQALQLIANEAPEPSKTEFLRVLHEVTLGGSMETALAGLAERIPTEDVEILATAIELQHQTGGNLSHVLDVIATTVRERHRVEQDISAMTSQQRFSAILLAALPYLLALVIFAISPTYVGHLFTMGWVLCMPVGAVIFSVIGLVIMRRIASIDV